MHDQLFDFHLPQQLVEQQERQVQLVGNLAAAGVAARQQQLENQRLDSR